MVRVALWKSSGHVAKSMDLRTRKYEQPTLKPFCFSAPHPTTPCNPMQLAADAQTRVQARHLIFIRSHRTSVCPSWSAPSALSGRVLVDRLYAARRLAVSNERFERDHSLFDVRRSPSAGSTQHQAPCASPLAWQSKVECARWRARWARQLGRRRSCPRVQICLWSSGASFYADPVEHVSDQAPQIRLPSCPPSGTSCQLETLLSPLPSTPPSTLSSGSTPPPTCPPTYHPNSTNFILGNTPSYSILLFNYRP